jgi:hypothetical protein
MGTAESCQRRTLTFQEVAGSPFLKSGGVDLTILKQWSIATLTLCL